MIKSNYQIDLKDTHHFSNKNGMIIDANNNSKFFNNNNINTANGQIIVPCMNPILVSANCPSNNKIQNNSCSAISNDIVNKIKKNLEQKAFMISKQQNVSKIFSFTVLLNYNFFKIFFIEISS